MQVTCWYDYACPYSYKAFLWLEALVAAGEDVDVAWRTFSLKEANRDPDTPSLLAAEAPGPVSVLALALAHGAREGDFERYHRAVLTAMHAEGRRLGDADLLAMAQAAGVDTAAFEAGVGRWVAAVAAEHSAGASGHGVFGTPTLVLAGEAVVFLKLADPPAEGEAVGLWRSLCTLARCHPELLEIKRPG